MNRMWTRLGWTAALLLAGLACAASATRAAEQRKPIRLLAEAEDFTVRGDGWQVVPYRENYFAATFAVSFLSRMGCLGAAEQVPAAEPAVAEQTVRIPYADQFEVLVRYEQPFNFSAEFTIEVEQNGRVVYRAVCGKLEDPKIWAFNGHQRVPMVRYFWGGTDNIVWQHPGSVRLAPGTATIRLIAGAQTDGRKLRLNAARRNVDLVCLTNDRQGMEAQKKTRYLEFDGWLVQDGDLYVRVTNPAGGPGPCIPVIGPFKTGQHSSYYVHVRDWPATKVLRSGRLVDPTAYELAGPRSLAVRPQLLAPKLDPDKFIPPPDPEKPAARPVVVIPDEQYLRPGDTSGWVPMGHVLDALNTCQWFPNAIYKEPKPEGLDLELEFAVPDGRGGLKPIKKCRVRGKPGYYSPVTFEISGNIAPNASMAEILGQRYWLPQVRTQKEALDWLAAEVAKFPKRGSTPKRLLIYKILGFSGALNVFPEARRLALALGDNTAVNQEGKKRGMVEHWPNTSMEFVRKQEVDDLHVVSYGDEIHLPPAGPSDEEFAAWLRSKGAKVSGPARYTTDRNNPLYYYSVLCGMENGAKPYIAASAYYNSKGVLTGANYSPHANYLVTEMHYLRVFKLRAMTMPWSEDYVWGIPEFSVQVTGYLTSGLRAGAKYHRMPIMMYVMPHSPGNTPRDFRLSFYTAIGHGATMINYFCASPLAVGGTENYIATDDLATWREIYNCTHEAGVFEDYVVDGKVHRAKVGLLLSSVDDVLAGAANTTLAMHNNERKAIYYALRHSQVPVDFLSEDDLVEGLARDCRVLYVTQQWLHSNAVDALVRWVNDGGTLVAFCGGGFLDEFNKPNPAANELYGVKSQQIGTDPQLVKKYLLEPNKPFLTKQDLPLYEPIDAASWSLDEAMPPSLIGERGPPRIRNVPVIVWKQSLEPDDAAVLGTFRDGRPAVLGKRHGKGKVYLFGFLPGQAYLKSGLPILPADRGTTDASFAHLLPTGMDVNLRRRLVDDFLPGDGEKVWVCDLKPVECSADLVETTCIDTPPLGGNPARLAVPLMNYSGKPIGQMTVKIAGLPNARSVRSVERGPLAPVFDGDKMTVELPLDVADMLLIDK